MSADQHVCEVSGGAAAKSPRGVIKDGSTPVPVLHVRQPWLTYIAAGSKTIEGRLGNPAKHAGLRRAPAVRLSDGEAYVLVEVREVVHYDTLESYLRECWQKAAPHAQTPEDAAAKYGELGDTFSPERVGGRGIDALHISLLLPESAEPTP